MTAGDFSPRDLQAKLERLIGHMNVRFKPIFEGIIAYTNDKPFGSLSSRGVAFKLSSTDRKRLIEMGGTPLQYGPDEPPSKVYTLVPDLIFEDEASLRSWLARSVGYIASLDETGKPAARKLKRSTRLGKY